MTTIRVAKTAAATLPHIFDVDETPTNSTTSVTVAVTDALGVSVASGAATQDTANTGRYTFPLPTQAQLSTLTVAWSATIAGAAVVETDTVEVCGGFLFSLREARNSDPALANAKKYTTQDLIDARQAVEEECELICSRAFVPRYRRVVLNGTGVSDLALPDCGDELVAGILLRGVRTIRSATVAPRIGQTSVALTAGQLAALAVTSDGILRRTDANIWPEGLSNVVVEYEFGNDGPPADLKRASLLRLRSQLNLSTSGIPDRATSFTAADGGTYRLSLPEAYKTGIPEVDGRYARYSRRARGGTTGSTGEAVPASRTLTYQPQRYSLFHRNPR